MTVTGVLQSTICNLKSKFLRGIITPVTVAFHLPGGIPVYTYSLMLGLGAVVGLAWVAWRAPSGRALSMVDAGLWTLAGALLGGRAAYIALNWGYYQAQPLEIPQVWLGGLSWFGALLGGLLALAMLALFTDWLFGELADATLPLLAALTVGAWLACWVDGCAYGPPANSWLGLPSRDEWGVIALRLPVQLVGALLSLAVFWTLDRADVRRLFGVDGLAAALAVSGVAAVILVLSFLRADPAQTWRGLRLDAWGALVVLVPAGLLAAWLFYSRPRDNL